MLMAGSNLMTGSNLKSNSNSNNPTSRHAVLYLHVDPNVPDLVDQYKTHVDTHNAAILSDPYPNSGFDLLFPQTENFKINSFASKFVDLRVKGEMRVYDNTLADWKTTGFSVFPRSSISKTPLMLANHTGIIDSGYRGFLLGAFRCLGAFVDHASVKPPDAINHEYVVEKNTRLLQICSPDLRPIFVKMVDESFFETTARGAGGFGSTGR